MSANGNVLLEVLCGLSLAASLIVISARHAHSDLSLLNHSLSILQGIRNFSEAASRGPCHAELSAEIDELLIVCRAGEAKGISVSVHPR